MIKSYILPAIAVMMLCSVIIKYNVNSQVNSSLYTERNLTFYEKVLVDEYKMIPNSYTLSGRYVSVSMSSVLNDKTAVWLFNPDGTFSHTVENNGEELKVQGRFDIINSVVEFSDLRGAIALIPPSLAIDKKKDKMYFILAGDVSEILQKTVI
ncbi:hypothetical protein UA32_12605 [Photobacterium angustum]|uniref:Uncharacterized protein n=1 Tax=Photobacterium angustum TaxID=661 RepID=A0ABX5H1F9_PHOAN|nr:hypothetical protein [Photobacterium angustum]KJG37786.1 hypothetical protein UA32_12605 [Photobacterium angustum]PSX07056.1 hypothetical protein C0W27_15925 [Photobacterium angustum]